MHTGHTCLHLAACQVAPGRTRLRLPRRGSQFCEPALPALHAPQVTQAGLFDPDNQATITNTLGSCGTPCPGALGSCA